ncbi:MAG: tyrosine-type recombinase/integrase [Bacilli bacterium]|nr:tyrosine-type recombinase/integrase [Bacilli bacterium]
MNKTINEVYVEYLEFLKLNKKQTTIYKIQLQFKNHILPELGNIKINELNKEVYINFLARIKNLGYNSSFYNQIQHIMAGLYDYLMLVYDVNNIVISVNKLFRQKEEKKVVNNTWNKKTFKKFIKKVDDPVYSCLFSTLFYTGIRKGEALALQVKNLNNGFLTIEHTLTKELFNGKRLLTPTKNGKIRVIKLDFFTNMQLKKLIKHYKLNYSSFNEDFFLFGAVKPIPCTTLERKKNYYCDLAQVKRIRIHDFRHSHATILHKSNVKIKQIQERLGHSDVNTTLNTYVHIQKSEEKRLIRKINLLRL